MGINWDEWLSIVMLMFKWTTAAGVVLAVYLILYTIINSIYGAIDWKIKMWRANRAEKKFNEEAKARRGRH